MFGYVGEIKSIIKEYIFITDVMQFACAAGRPGSNRHLRQSHLRCSQLVGDGFGPLLAELGGVLGLRCAQSGQLCLDGR